MANEEREGQQRTLPAMPGDGFIPPGGAVILPRSSGVIGGASYQSPLGVGEPPVVTGTEPVYDTKPFNATVISFTNTEEFTSVNSCGENSEVILEFKVPYGKVFYLKEIFLEIEDITLTNGCNPI